MLFCPNHGSATSAIKENHTTKKILNCGICLHDTQYSAEHECGLCVHFMRD